jgi:hypothetical protein
VHGVIAKRPKLLASLERAGGTKPGLARNIVYQYHYVGGVKDALARERA